MGQEIVPRALILLVELLVRGRQQNRHDVVGGDGEALADIDRRGALQRVGQRHRIDRHHAVHARPGSQPVHLGEQRRSGGEIGGEVHVLRILRHQLAVEVLLVLGELGHRRVEESQGPAGGALLQNADLAVVGLDQREGAEDPAGGARLGQVLEDHQIGARPVGPEHRRHQTRDPRARPGDVGGPVQFAGQAVHRIADRPDDVRSVDRGQLFPAWFTAASAFCSSGEICCSGSTSMVPPLGANSLGCRVVAICTSDGITFCASESTVRVTSRMASRLLPTKGITVAAR